MSFYISFILYDNIKIEHLNKLGKKYGLKFSTLDVDRVLSSVNIYENLQHILLEWVDDKYDVAIQSLHKNTISFDILERLNKYLPICSNQFLNNLKQEKENDKISEQLALENLTFFFERVFF